MTAIKLASRIIVWNAGILVAGTLAIELAFGNWLRDDPLRHLHILRGGVWDYEISYPGIAEESRNVVYSRDRFGLRGDYGAPEDIDILTVGGSTTDQRFISDGHTWQDVLSNRFARGGRDVRVANAGLDGRTTFGHLHDFDLWFPTIEGLDPSWVLLYTGINDMFFDGPNGRYDDAHDDDRSLADIVKANSAIVYLFRTVFGIRRAIERNLAYVSIDYEGAEWTDEPLMSNHREKLTERLAGYASRVRQLLDRIAAMGATPIVVSQPRGDSRIVDGRVVGLASTNPRIYWVLNDAALGELRDGTANGVDYYRILSEFNDVSLELCREVGGICLDMANELRFEDGDFYDHAHNTRAGALKIGEYLYRKLQGRLTGTPVAPEG